MQMSSLIKQYWKCDCFNMAAETAQVRINEKPSRRRNGNEAEKVDLDLNILGLQLAESWPSVSGILETFIDWPRRIILLQSISAVVLCSSAHAHMLN